MNNLTELKTVALKELAELNSIEDLDNLILKYFGRKQGALTSVLRGLKDMSEQERKAVGQQANEIKIEIWRQIDQKRYDLKNTGKQQIIDLTIDGTKSTRGHLHPLTQVRREIEAVFKDMGFARLAGPEIESDYYNFEALNMPSEHPARDMWDTFYVKKGRGMRAEGGEKLVLRTHISPMQIRVMERFKPPFAVVSSGRVFRHEATDARHEHTWDYTEGFLVGENISLANLKSTLLTFFQKLFGTKTEIKLRSSYFPFTEPSLEIIMSCIFCNKKGCSVCHTGWLEMGGAGMIHPNVFKFAGYPKDKYSGFAFGIGISRVAMLKYNIPDIRMLYQNDVRFTKQF
jgi:phenylalanyl-tRNA synthetase alpha chain